MTVTNTRSLLTIFLMLWENHGIMLLYLRSLHSLAGVA